MRVACTHDEHGVATSLAAAAVGRTDDHELAEAVRERRSQVDARLGELVRLAGDAQRRLEDAPAGRRRRLVAPVRSAASVATPASPSGVTAYASTWSAGGWSSRPAASAAPVGIEHDEVAARNAERARRRAHVERERRAGPSVWPNTSRSAPRASRGSACAPWATPRIASVLPQLSTLSPGSAGSTRTTSLASVFASSGFVNSIRHGVERCAAPVPAALALAHAERAVACGSSSARPLVLRGPSADGVPGRRSPRPPRPAAAALGPEREPAAGLGACGRDARRPRPPRPPRPWRGARARLRRRAGRADAHAREHGRGVDALVEGREEQRVAARGTALGMLGDEPRRRRPEAPRDGARERRPPWRSCPAGIVARYSLAIGKRPSGSNTSVRVPTQRHSPGGCGSSRTGTPSCASSACESSATIGCENVTESCGASGTSPSGARRSTVSGPVAGASLREAPPVGRRERRALGAARPRRRQRRLAQRERRRARLLRERRQAIRDAARGESVELRRFGTRDERGRLGRVGALAQPEARLGGDLPGGLAVRIDWARTPDRCGAPAAPAPRRGPVPRAGRARVPGARATQAASPRRGYSARGVFIPPLAL